MKTLTSAYLGITQTHDLSKSRTFLGTQKLNLVRQNSFYKLLNSTLINQEEKLINESRFS